MDLIGQNSFDLPWFLSHEFQKTMEGMLRYSLNQILLQFLDMQFRCYHHN